DAESDYRRLAAALARFTAAERGADTDDRSDRRARERDERTLAPGVVQLQVSWEPGWVVAWGGGPRTRTADDEELVALLGAGEAPGAPMPPTRCAGCRPSSTRAVWPRWPARRRAASSLSIRVSTPER